jgi:broad specificity phosphatase PhoE
MDLQIKDRPDVWLVRHGQSTWNALGWQQGQSDDAGLTFHGYRQVHHAVDSLGTKDVDRVYSSDLRRARQTASIVARALGCDVVVDERLRERSFGAAEGSPSTDIGPELSGIRDGRVIDFDAHAKGGESLLDVYLRCSDFVMWLVTQRHRRDVIVVAHGGSIRMLEAAAARSGIVDMAWDEIANASTHRFVLPMASTMTTSRPLVTATNRREP